jgi:hypothetical protein
MTTTIKVLAHCNPETTVVEVVLIKDEKIDMKMLLENNNEFTWNIHGSNQELQIREIDRPE